MTKLQCEMPLLLSKVNFMFRNRRQILGNRKKVKQLLLTQYPYSIYICKHDDFPDQQRKPFHANRQHRKD